MFTLTTRSFFIYSFALVLFLFHALAEAGLVRGGGRGTYSDSSNTDFVLVANDQINDLGLREGYTAVEVNGFNSGLDALLATPSFCDIEFFDFQDLQDAINFGGFVEEPCYYQVYENDPTIDFLGFGRGLFQLASNVEITWTLSRAGETPIVLAGAASDISGENVSYIGPMPTELFAGEYLVDLTVEFFSGPNMEFFRASGDSTDDVGCDEVAPGDVQCYMREFSPSDTLRFDSAFSERLVVLPGSAPINEPAMWGLLGLGLLLLRRSTTK
ncbi:hypothetical protein [Aliiglaciecola litoralis]|uniref:PEP-CTERM protein-sorting domain-containing protein n=1 Tax=Aliiglaciecola litoralis TaxID=582857 RepID=A0ABN1LT43_9ALTE